MMDYFIRTCIIIFSRLRHKTLTYTVLYSNSMGNNRGRSIIARNGSRQQDPPLLGVWFVQQNFHSSSKHIASLVGFNLR